MVFLQDQLAITFEERRVLKFGVEVGIAADFKKFEGGPKVVSYFREVLVGRDEVLVILDLGKEGVELGAFRLNVVELVLLVDRDLVL